MRGVKYLVMLMLLFPVMPDLACVSLYAAEGTPAESVDNYLAAILFFLCVLLGNRLWKVFVNSFEKGGILMCRKLLLAALLCLVWSPLAWCQSNVSLTRLIETNLVQNTALTYLIIPGRLNGQPGLPVGQTGQGKYYLVFYMGLENPLPGVVQQVSAFVAVEQVGAVYTVVNAIPCRNQSTGNVIMVPPFPPDVSRGDENFLLYSHNDIVSWVKAYNVVLNMLPWSLVEFQAIMGNNRDYQMTFLPFRDLTEVENELEQWNDFFDDNPPPVIGGMSPNVPALLRGVLFFLCVACGACFFGSFIESFEKGSF